MGLPSEAGGGHARHSLEELDHERWIGKIHVVCNVRNGFVAVLELDLDASDKGIVDPLLGTLAAHLSDDGAHVTWCDTQARGIIVDSMMSGCKLAHQLDEVGEQALLARLVLAISLLVLTPQVIHIPQ